MPSGVTACPSCWTVDELRPARAVARGFGIIGRVVKKNDERHTVTFEEVRPETHGRHWRSLPQKNGALSGRLRRISVACAAAIFLISCSADPTSGTPDKETVGADDGNKNVESTTDKPEVTLVDSGFGQSGAYVQGIAIVTNSSDASVGEFVTVSANFLDKSGDIIGTEEQVESFSWVGQQLVLPIWLDLSDNESAKVSKMEASVSISDYGAAQPKPALPILKSTEVKKTKYEGTTTSFAFKNTTDNDLENLRVGVVCYNKGGDINGGQSAYPNLSPAGKTIRIDSSVTTSGTPKACKAFLNYGAA